MLPPQLQSSLSTLAVIATDPELAEAARVRWRAGGRGGAVEPTKLPDAMRVAADELSAALPELTRADGDALAPLFADAGGEVLFAWCAASTWRRDASMARLLKEAAAQPAFRERVDRRGARSRHRRAAARRDLVRAAARRRTRASRCPENAEARARLEILVWEAGASALEVPASRQVDLGLGRARSTR